MQSLSDLMSRFDVSLGGTPGWLVTLLLVLLAAGVALVAFSIVHRTLQRVFAARHAFVGLLLEKLEAPARAAVVMLAAALVLQIAPLQPGAARVSGQILLVALIIVLGWISLTIIAIASDLYLRRYTDRNVLTARKHITQVRILQRTAVTLVVTITIAAALMTFDAVRQLGVSLFASAGAAGLVLGFAARPVLSNLIAGIQLAITQPIRIDDSVVVENEFGVIEEITSTYVVVKLWDWRRLIVPLSYFMEKPFQNWTRDGTALVGAVSFFVDYTAPVDMLRDKAMDIVRQSPLWDGDVCKLVVNDARERTMELRVLVSAKNAAGAGDLKNEVREKLIAFLRDHHPDALPRERRVIDVPHRSDSDPPVPR